MTGNLGRRARFSVFVVTGNQKGLAGFAVGKAPNLMAAVRKAKNRAGQKLIFLNLFEGHTGEFLFILKAALGSCSGFSYL